MAAEMITSDKKFMARWERTRKRGFGVYLALGSLLRGIVFYLILLGMLFLAEKLVTVSSEISGVLFFAAIPMGLLLGLAFSAFRWYRRNTRYEILAAFEKGSVPSSKKE